MAPLRNRIKRCTEAVSRFATGTRLGRALVFVSLPLALLIFTFWPTHHEPPIFDAQVHYNDNSWQQVSVNAVLNTAREFNVPWLLVSSTPNEGTLRLHRAAPEQVIPMLVPYNDREQRHTWFNDADTLDYIAGELRRGIYRGIGEFHLYDGQVDTPVIRGVIALAMRYNLVLHARSDASALRQLFALEPRLRILWAHAGMLTPVDTIDDMLFRYPRLWAEISHRSDVAPSGSLSNQWRKLLMKYPTRFLLGTGTYTTEYWYQFRHMLTRYRSWLNKLPLDVALRLSHRNGLELFQLNY